MEGCPLYKTSKDKRFQKNKKDIRKAWIELTMEKGYGKVSISDIAKRADINRMTFYAHYDEVSDIFTEFVDDMENVLMHAIKKNPEMTLDEFLRLANTLMFQEIAFFQYVAKEGNCSDFRVAFQKAFKKLIEVNFSKDCNLTDVERNIEADLASVCIAYAYLDWLAGEYGDVELDVVIQHLENLISSDKLLINFK